MKYVLMFAGSTSDQEAWDKMTEEQKASSYDGVMKWWEEHSKAGRIVGGAELKGPANSTTVRLKNGKVTVTDGPYIESKEVVGGFAIVEVKDLDEALAMAKTWPGGVDHAVEIRPVVPH